MVDVEHFVEFSRLHREPMMLLSSSGKVLEANTPALKALDADRADVIGKSFEELCYEPKEAMLEYLRLCLRNKQLIPGAFSTRYGGDTSKFWSWGGLLRPRSQDRQGLVLLIFGKKSEASQSFLLLNQKINQLTSEVSRRQKITEELEIAKQKAEAASRAKSEFLAMMSHEIRTPLSVILGYAELMCHQPPADQQNYLTTIQRNGEQLLTLISDILDLSRVESGNLKLEPHRFHLKEFFDEVRLSLVPKAHAKGLYLTVASRGRVPSYVVSDKVRLRQILTNVVDNAIKFTEKGGVKLTIEADTSSKDSAKILVHVADTGCGIKEMDQKKLFRPFSQADSSLSRQHEGTGLGLMLSRRLARALGGDVLLTESEPGKGSAFTISIDAGPPEKLEFVEDFQSASKDPFATSDPLGASGKLRNVRVLLVEDSEDMRFLVSQMIKRAGGTVELAENGEEGIAKAKAGKYDVVLMDLRMPKVNGYDAIRYLRQIGYDTPIIALTAHAMAEERDHCIQVGCDDFLTKPVERELLISMIARWAS